MDTRLILAIHTRIRYCCCTHVRLRLTADKLIHPITLVVDSQLNSIAANRIIGPLNYNLCPANVIIVGAKKSCVLH